MRRRSLLVFAMFVGSVSAQIAIAAFLILSHRDTPMALEWPFCIEANKNAEYAVYSVARKQDGITQVVWWRDVSSSGENTLGSTEQPVEAGRLRRLARQVSSQVATDATIKVSGWPLHSIGYSRWSDDVRWHYSVVVL